MKTHSTGNTVVVTAAGAGVGATIGLLVGTALGPPGMVVGALVGASGAGLISVCCGFWLMFSIYLHGW